MTAFSGKNSRNSLQSWAASVLLWAITSAGRWTAAIVAGHREGLAGPGGAEQGLEALAGLEALGEPGDRLRLVGGRRVGGVQLEIGHNPR